MRDRNSPMKKKVVKKITLNKRKYLSINNNNHIQGGNNQAEGAVPILYNYNKFNELLVKFKIDYHNMGNNVLTFNKGRRCNR